MLVRVIDGALKKGQRIRADGLGRRLSGRARRHLPPQAGDAGSARARRGRLLHRRHQAGGRHARRRHGHRREASRPSNALPGFKPAQPVVFCGLFPVDAAQFEDLREAMARLRLNDASFTYETESSAALGFGFRCGFLGLLHLEIITERLEREFNLELITTAPSVIYHIYLTDGTKLEMHNPADMPDPVKIDRIEEPWIEATILVPDEHLGSGLEAVPGPPRAAEEPHLRRLARAAGLRAAAQRGGVRLLRPAEVDQPRLCLLRLPASAATRRATSSRCRSWSTPSRSMRSPSSCTARAPRAAAAPWCEKLKELIPPHMFQIPIQAAIGGRIIARETIRALRKDVLAKCYGGDITQEAQAAREAEEGQEAHAPVRPGRDPPGGLHRRAQDGGELKAAAPRAGAPGAIFVDKPVHCRPEWARRPCGQCPVSALSSTISANGLRPAE